MKLPAHKAALYLRHNEHLGVYKTVQDRLDEGYIDDDHWVSPEQREKAIATNELWELQWYPSTPVGFCLLRGADLDVVLAAANE